MHFYAPTYHVHFIQIKYFATFSYLKLYKRQYYQVDACEKDNMSKKKARSSSEATQKKYTRMKKNHEIRARIDNQKSFSFDFSPKNFYRARTSVRKPYITCITYICHPIHNQSDVLILFCFAAVAFFSLNSLNSFNFWTQWIQVFSVRARIRTIQSCLMLWSILPGHIQIFWAFFSSVAVHFAFQKLLLNWILLMIVVVAPWVTTNRSDVAEESENFIENCIYQKFIEIKSNFFATVDDLLLWRKAPWFGLFVLCKITVLYLVYIFQFGIFKQHVHIRHI